MHMVLSERGRSLPFIYLWAELVSPSASTLLNMQLPRRSMTTRLLTRREEPRHLRRQLPILLTPDKWELAFKKRTKKKNVLLPCRC